MHDEDRVPIWLYIGTVLTVYGTLIFGAGLYALAFPPPVESRVALFEWHADVWWGAFMILVGVAYMARFRPGGRSGASDPGGGSLN